MRAGVPATPPGSCVRTAFIVLCILSNFVISDDQAAGSVIQQQTQSGQVNTPVLPAPAEAAPAEAEGAASTEGE